MLRSAVWAGALLFTATALAQDPELAAKLQPYREFRSHALLAWHPMLRGVLARPETPGNSKVQLLMAPLATPAPLETPHGAATGAAFQPGRGKLIHLVAKAEGAAPQWFRVDLDTNGYAALGEDGDAFAGCWSRKGERFAYATGGAGKVTVRVVDPDTIAPPKILAEWEGGPWDSCSFSADGKRIVFAAAVPSTSRLWLLDTATGRKRPIAIAAKDRVTYSRPVFAPDGRGVFAIADRSSQPRRLVYLALAGGKERVLAARHAHDVEHLAISNVTGMVAFTTSEDGAHVLRFLDAKSFQELSRPPLFPGVIGHLEWRPGFPEVGFDIRSARTAGDVFSYDVQANRLTRWTNGNNPAVNTSQFAEPRVVRWKTADGVQAYGLLYTPPTRHAGKRPVFIDRRDSEAPPRPGFLGDVNYVVNELGVAVLYPHPRAGTDLSPLLAWIRGQPDLDAARVRIDTSSGDTARLVEFARALLQ